MEVPALRVHHLRVPRVEVAARGSAPPLDVGRQEAPAAPQGDFRMMADAAHRDAAPEVSEAMFDRIDDLLIEWRVSDLAYTCPLGKCLRPKSHTGECWP